MLKIIYKTMYYIVDAMIGFELICSRLWQASQFYTPDSQTVWYNKNKKNKQNKTKKTIYDVVIIQTIHIVHLVQIQFALFCIINHISITFFE